MAMGLDFVCMCVWGGGEGHICLVNVCVCREGGMYIFSECVCAWVREKGRGRREGGAGDGRGR